MMQMDLCRNNDLVRTGDGSTAAPGLFNRLMYGLAQVSQYQRVQVSPDALKLNLVSSAPLPPDAVEAIRAAVRAGGPQMTRDRVPRRDPTHHCGQTSFRHRAQ